MKTFNLIISVALILTAGFSSAQLTPEAAASAPVASTDGLLVIEAINDDGSPVRGVNTPRFDDSLLARACCVQPELGGFKNPLITALESLASWHTFPAIIEGAVKNVCNKVTFLTALNSSEQFQELRKQNRNVVLQIRAKDITSAALLSCISK